MNISISKPTRNLYIFYIKYGNEVRNKIAESVKRANRLEKITHLRTTNLHKFC